MIDAANRKLEGQSTQVKDNVKFQVVDADNMDFEEATFDAVFCKDAFLYVAEKSKVLSQILKWLKPGGRLLLIDHMRGSNKVDDQTLREFCEGRHWHLRTIEEQKRLIDKSGFTDTSACNISQEFLLYMETSADGIHKKQKFTREEKQYHAMEDQKIAWCQDQLLSWAVFTARKPV